MERRETNPEPGFELPSSLNRHSDGARCLRSSDPAQLDESVEERRSEHAAEVWPTFAPIQTDSIHNLLRTREAVVNLPSEGLSPHIERIARTTGRTPIPASKHAMGYVYEPDKFRRAGLTAISSEVVHPPRIAECPLQLEAVLLAHHPGVPTAEDPDPGFASVELRVVRVHAHEEVTIAGTNHVDTRRWRPLFYVFRHYFGLGAEHGKNFRAET